MRRITLAVALLVAGSVLAQEGPDREKLKDALKNLENQLREAKEKSQHDRAEKLGREIEEVRANIEKARQPRPEGDERRNADRQKAKEVLKDLENQLREAKERGQPDRAEKLAREMEEVRRKLEDPKEPRPGEEDRRNTERQRIKAEIQELLREADKAQEKGRGEVADDLRRKAQDLKRRLEEGPRGGEEVGPGEKMIDRIAMTRKEALRAKREGRPEKARDLWEQANRLDRELQVGEEFGPREGPMDPMQPERKAAIRQRVQREPVLRAGPAPQELEREIQNLRREVQELRNLLNRAVEEKRRQPAGDQPERGRERPI